jgi:hypothetical protein
MQTYPAAVMVALVVDQEETPEDKLAERHLLLDKETTVALVIMPSITVVAVVAVPLLRVQTVLLQETVEQVLRLPSRGLLLPMPAAVGVACLLFLVERLVLVALVVVAQVAMPLRLTGRQALQTPEAVGVVLDATTLTVEPAEQVVLGL